MLNQTPHKTIYPAIVLLSLFLMGLASQSLHQIRNMAWSPVACGTVDHHFHQDPDSHHCDLCDFKISSFQDIQLTFSDLRFTSVRSLIEAWQLVVTNIIPISNRAPPLT